MHRPDIYNIIRSKTLLRRFFLECLATLNDLCYSNPHFPLGPAVKNEIKHVQSTVHGC